MNCIRRWRNRNSEHHELDESSVRGLYTGVSADSIRMSLYSEYTFSYMTPLVSVGQKRPLHPDDILPLLPRHDPFVHAQELVHRWDSFVCADAQAHAIDRSRSPALPAPHVPLSTARRRRQPASSYARFDDDSDEVPQESLETGGGQPVEMGVVAAAPTPSVPTPDSVPAPVPSTDAPATPRLVAVLPLFLILLRVCYAPALELGLALVVDSANRFWQAHLVGDLVRTASDYDAAVALGSGAAAVVRSGYIAAGCMAASVLLHTIVHHRFCMLGLTLGVHMRQGLVVLIHRKLLRLAPEHTEAGMVSNLVATDVFKMDKFSIYLHSLWLGPVQLVLLFVFIRGYMGALPALAALSAMSLMMLLQLRLATAVARWRGRIAVATDARLRTLREFLGAVETWKSLDLERFYARLLRGARGEEVLKFLGAARVKSMNLTVFTCWMALVTLPALFVYKLQGGVLTAEKVFALTSLLTVAKKDLGNRFATACEFSSDFRVALGRISRFLLLPELEAPPLPHYGDVTQAKHQMPSGPAPGAAESASESSSAVTEAGALPAPGPVAGADPCYTLLADHRYGSVRHVTPPAAASPAASPAVALAQAPEAGQEGPRMSVEVENVSLTRGGLSKPNSSGSGSGKADAAPAPRTLLRSLSVSLAGPQLVVVLGAVGSGKTSFLQLLLRELAPDASTPGAEADESDSSSSPSPSSTDLSDPSSPAPAPAPRVCLRGSVSYVPQRPWVSVGSVRDNITCGREGPAMGDSGLILARPRSADAVTRKTAAATDAAAAAAAAPRSLAERISAAAAEARLVWGQPSARALFATAHQRAPVSSSSEASPQPRRGGPEWLARVLAACGLAREAAGLWPEGLEKHVGEAAAGLSGGEQSRVALARAVYSDADVVLLDDVLAALDGATRSLVADELLRGLLRDKLVVLATHDAWVAQHADHVLWLDAADAAEAEAEVQDGGDGRGATSASAPAFNSNPTRPTARDPPPGVSVFGRTWSGPGPAMRRDPLLQALMARVPEEEAAEETPDGSSKAVQSSDEAEEAKGGDERPVMEELGDTPFADADDADDADAVPEEDPASAAPAAGTAAESLATGRVTSSVYAVYASLCGGKLWVAAVLLLCGLCQAALLLTSQAVVWWVEYDSSADHAPSHGVLNFYGAFYLGQVVLLAAFGWVRNQTLLRGCLAGGRLVHARMLQGVTRAPLAWFGAHPMGQVMNRFSADLAELDDRLPYLFLEFSQISSEVVATVILVCVLNPLITLALLPLLLTFLWLRKRYLAVAPQIKRAEAIAKSPVYSLFSASLDGAPSIRHTPQLAPVMHARLVHALREHSTVFFMNLGLARWFGLRLDALGSIFLSLTCFLAVASLGSMDSAYVGWSISSVMMLMSIFQWTVRLTAEIDTAMTSVERVDEYSAIPAEAPATGPDPAVLWQPQQEPQPGAHAGGVLEAVPLCSCAGDPAPPPRPWRSHAASCPCLRAWPPRCQGLALLLRHVSMRYHPAAAPALKDVSLWFPAGAAVLIVGRSGSGKSSLFKALLRLFEADGYGRDDGRDDGHCVEQDGAHSRTRDALASGDLSDAEDGDGELPSASGCPHGGDGSICSHGNDAVPESGIFLSGARTACLGLRRVRSLISAVPQRPVLMRASLRTNLDPLGRRSDAELEEALLRVRLRDRFFGAGTGAEAEADGEVKVALPGMAAATWSKGSNSNSDSADAEVYGDVCAGLDTPIAADGANLSLGERQLVCAARALLREGAGVLVADECTASVDTQTGRVIEQALYEQARRTGQTLVVVSHRVRVPWVPDLVVVMGEGRVRETGTWAELVARRGVFWEMLQTQSNGEEE